MKIYFGKHYKNIYTYKNYATICDYLGRKPKPWASFAEPKNFWLEELKQFEDMGLLDEFGTED
jgi:hypothetical protein